MSKNPTPNGRLLRNLDRGWSVIRYYGKAQLARRACKVVAGRVNKLLGRRPSVPDDDIYLPFRDLTSLVVIGERKLAWRTEDGAVERAAAVLEGRFSLLNKERTLPDPIDWRLAKFPNASHLWRFQLHYQEYLLDLLAAHRQTDDPRYVDRARDLIDQWIAGNPPEERASHESAWHPYCISRRVPVWMVCFALAPPDAECGDRARRSIGRQLELLSNNLEKDLRGNHLLENLKALAFGGALLDGPIAERWLQLSDTMLRTELAHQLLPHGEHYERSPMYHTHVLELLVELAIVTRDAAPELATFCADQAERMADFLRPLLHPDARIPLLGDACFGEAAPSAHVLNAADAVRSAPIPNEPHRDRTAAQVHGDYWTYRDGDNYLLFDAGPVGPNDLPGHAHCDLFNIEASLFGQRAIVDTGLYDYADSEMRRFCRSTAAHNTLEVDGLNQCDVWGGFRMGYRGEPGEFASGETEGFSWATARHNAYRRAGVPFVHRWIACRPGGPWLCVDWATGRGAHELTSRLHLHPDACAEQTAPDEITLTFGRNTAKIQFLGPGVLTLETSWYCLRFGVRIPNQVAVWRSAVELPAAIGWRLQLGELGGSAEIVWGEQAARPALRWSDGDGDVTLSL